MFQFEWKQKESWEKERNSFSRHDSKLSGTAVRRTSLLHWQEHCLECAPPLCYVSCPLYLARADRKCARFAYGIYPNGSFSGLFDHAADIRFRRWGKLETIVYGKSVTARAHRLLDRIDGLLTRTLSGSEDSNQRDGSVRRATNALAVFAKANLAKAWNKYFLWNAPTSASVAYDEFVLECFSPDEGAFRLVLEYFAGEIKLRHSFNILPGWNFYTLPAQAFRFGEGPPRGKIAIYPENNGERRLILTWLDLVRYGEVHNAAAAKNDDARPVPAAKVKCVAWDLDNTLWRGVLAEDGEMNVTPVVEALELARRLDERGIVQTIVSKNNFADAWPVIERLGLRDYFLYPAINWEPKSVNLKEVAQKLNINVDTFALIDDAPFERAEVQSALPQVRTYSDEQIGELLTYEEFGVPVTEASKKRRASYVTEIERDKAKERFGDYEAFLRSCEMKLRLFVPREERHIQRCLELIQRSNQLNLSGTRYTAEELHELLSSPDVLCVAMDCQDRFGAYGIVGFASVVENRQKPVLRDLVLSCRVAKKRVEHTFLEWLAAREASRGLNVLRAELVRTDGNKPIRQVFDDLHFRKLADENGQSLMEWALDPEFTVGNIIEIQTEPELQTAMMAANRNAIT